MFIIIHGKFLCADVVPNDRTIAFTEGALCDYTFGYSAFPLWVSSCTAS